MNEASASSHQERSALVVPGVLLAVLAISFAAIFFRLAAPTHPLVMAGLRLAIASGCLMPFLLRSYRKGRFGRRMFKSALLGGLLYAIHFGTWVTSLTMTSVAASVTLVTTTPLILAVIGAISGRDRPSKRLWISLGLATIGLLLLGGQDSIRSHQALAGDLLAITGAMAMAGYYMVVRRLGSAIDLLAFSAVATGLGAFLLLGCAWLMGIEIQVSSSLAFAYIALAALLPQLVGHNLLTWALRYAKPATVAMAVVGEPVMASLLGWIWLSEGISTISVFGCGITLSAVLIAVVQYRSISVSISSK